MVFSIFQANKKAKSAEVNDNFAFISGNRLIAVNASTGAPIATFPIGDLTAITNGSLAGDILGRTGSSLKVYSATGVLIGSISYDSLLNLQDASQTQKGVVELATNAEVTAGTDTQRAIVPSALANLYGASSASANSNFRIPIKVGGTFAEGIIQSGVSSSVAGNSTTTITFPAAFPNSTDPVIIITPQGAYNPSAQANSTVSSVSATGFTLNAGNIGTIPYKWFAIGY